MRWALLALVLAARVASADEITMPVAEVRKPGDKIVAKDTGKGFESRRMAYGEKVALDLVRVTGKAAWKLHAHAGSEIVYVLDGEAEVRGPKGAKGTPLVTGDTVFVPAGAGHVLGAKGTKKQPTLLLVLHAPGSAALVGKADKTNTTEPVVVHSPAAPLDIAGGKGKVEMIVEKDSGGDGTVYAGRIHLDKGTKVPEHVHLSESEVLWVVSGSGTLTADGVALAVEGGVAVHVPPGVKHAFEATSDVDAIQFYAPGGPEQRFKSKPDVKKDVTK